MKVNGNSIPEKIVELGNKTYLNLGVKDISYTDENENKISLFSYEQFVFGRPCYPDILRKTEKEYRLQNIVVTTINGNEFDGNDLSQSRMVSAIMSAKASGKFELQWKLANNKIVLIQIEELEEALALSIDKVGEIITEIEGAE